MCLNGSFDRFFQLLVILSIGNEKIQIQNKRIYDKT
jgi:hypothetical protein